jgi:hypothetical protein
MLVVVFVFLSSLAEGDDKLGSRLIIILDYFSSITKDDNKPRGSSSPFNVCLSVVEDNDELKGSSSSWFYSSVAGDNNELGSQFVVILGFFSSIAKNDNEPRFRLIVVSWFFPQVQKMTTRLPGRCHFLHFFLQV